MVDMLLYNGDLVTDKYGDILLCTDESNDVIQTANNNILLRFGGNKFHKELGNRIYNRRIKASQNGIEIVQAECMEAIINGDTRVREVKRVIVTLLENASCMVDYILVYAKTKEVISDRDTETNVDTIEVINEEEEELIEIDGRTYINVFNMEGGDK